MNDKSDITLEKIANLAIEVIENIGQPRHNHQCFCGTATPTPHRVGKDGCVRSMTEAPAVRPDNRWFVDGYEITNYTLRQQRGYHQHDCGCWSRWPGSTNSINA